MDGGGWGGRLPGLTELEAVDAQARIRGVVQSSLLSPAAGGVRVHLPGCDACTGTVVNKQAQTGQFELKHIDDRRRKKKVLRRFFLQ